jgi:prophage regulatory protein
MDRMPSTNARLWGAHEIADALGVSKQRAHVLMRHQTFPDHVQQLNQGRIWWRDEVEAWITAYRRPRG